MKTEKWKKISPRLLNGERKSFILKWNHMLWKEPSWHWRTFKRKIFLHIWNFINFSNFNFRSWDYFKWKVWIIRPPFMVPKRSETLIWLRKIIRRKLVLRKLSQIASDIFRGNWNWIWGAANSLHISGKGSKRENPYSKRCLGNFLFAATVKVEKLAPSQFYRKRALGWRPLRQRRNFQPYLVQKLQIKKSQKIENGKMKEN